MRFSSVILLAVVAAGCAVQSPPRTPERRAANIAAAESAGYKVIHYGDRVVFCPTAPQTGSHIGSMCMSESEWEAATGTAPAGPSVRVNNKAPGPGPGAGH